jgi:hypothetical protein
MQQVGGHAFGALPAASADACPIAGPASVNAAVKMTANAPQRNAFLITARTGIRSSA